MRTVLLTLITFALVLPAHAQYSGGSGTAEDPHQIATAEDLIALGETPDDYDKHFILTADIDLDPNLPGGKVFNRAVIAPDGNDVEDGFQGTYFTGVFDGNDQTISSLTIKGGERLGLFGYLHGDGIVCNLHLESLDVNGTGYMVGGLVADNAGTVTGSFSTGRVSGGSTVGGLVGNNDGCISMSYSSATVKGFTVRIGGLAGWNDGTILNSHSIGTIDGTSTVGGLVGMNLANIADCFSTCSVSGDSQIGGLVGVNWNGKIMGSCSTGTVNGSGGIVGGLVGDNRGSISMSYSSGTVSGSDWSVGGLVGQNGYISWSPGGMAGSIIHCYSIGTVSGESAVGGLVGSNYLGCVTASYCTGAVSGVSAVGGFMGVPGRSTTLGSFWDIQTSGSTDMCGGQSPVGERCDNTFGKTTAEMQTASTFLDARWDFVGETENGPNDVWEIVEGQTYPLLSWQKYGGGTGEPNDPYLIYTAEHLNALGAEPNDYDKHFKLMVDIDLSGYTYDRAVIAWDANDLESGFQGIAFSGVLDGNGRTISNLSITGGSYLGLFGQLGNGAVVSSLGLEAVDVNGTGDRIGGLVGSNGRWGDAGGLVINCYSNGVIRADREDRGWDIGGLVGLTSSGSIVNCYSMSDVCGNWGVGGLVGCSEFGTIKASYSMGKVAGRSSIGGLVGSNGEARITMSYSLSEVIGDQCIGGLVGSNDWSPIVSCYSAGKVNGNTEVGGLVGRSTYESDVGNCFWDTQTSGLTNMCGHEDMDCIGCDDSRGLTTTEMQSPAVLRAFGWDFIGLSDGPHDLWSEPEGGGYPMLYWQVVSMFDQLPEFAGGTGETDDPYLISSVEQLNAIGHNPRLMTRHFKLVSDLDLADVSVYSIGNSDYPYQAVFNGNGHEISHLQIEGVSQLGFFGCIGIGATVKDLGVVDVNISGYGLYIGGLAGINNGSITSCYSNGTVRGGTFVGGLVGDNSGQIAACYAAGVVGGLGNEIGGLVGFNGGDIAASYSTVAVTGDRRVGGLVGYNAGSIINSYSTGSVSGDSGVGGLVGKNYSTISACYSTGWVSGGMELGGLVGDSRSACTESSFWDVETSGLTTSNGGIGLTTAEIQTATTFLEAGWDFVDEAENGTDDVWWIDEGQDYPRLWWEFEGNDHE